VSRIFIIVKTLKLTCNLIANSFQKIKVELGFGAGEGIRTLDFNLGKVDEYKCA